MRSWSVVATAIAGCSVGTGIRTGTGVARSTQLAPLGSPISDDGIAVDSSYSQDWLQLDTLGELGVVRGLFSIGGGNSHMRFRGKGPSSMPIFAKDDNFHARVAFGFGLVTPPWHGLRLQPYGVYNVNLGDDTNTAGSTKELGVDFELMTRLGERGSSTVLVGVARTWEAGTAYPDFGNLGTYEGAYEVTGWMVTFGWHYAVRFERD
jgi:hypothetical protein